MRFWIKKNSFSGYFDSSKPTSFTNIFCLSIVSLNIPAIFYPAYLNTSFKIVFLNYLVDYFLKEKDASSLFQLCLLNFFHKG